jgi:hypothetical protein
LTTRTARPRAAALLDRRYVRSVPLRRDTVEGYVKVATEIERLDRDERGHRARP